MKKLLFAVPIIGTILFSVSCTKEPGTDTETVTVTQTDTVFISSTDTITVTKTDTLDESTTVTIIIEEFDQIYFSSTDTYASAEVYFLPIFSFKLIIFVELPILLQTKLFDFFKH